MRVYHNIKDFFIHFKRFCFNLWLFRKVLWEYEWWDYMYTLKLLETSFRHMADYTDKYGVSVHQDSKIEKMLEASDILNRCYYEPYVSLAEIELGQIRTLTIHKLDGSVEQKYLNEDETLPTRVYELSDKLEKDDWERLFVILKGSDEEGTNLKTWWD